METRFEAVSIEKHVCVSDQTSRIGKHAWSVARLIFLSKDFPVYEVPLIALNVYSKYDVTLREMVGHIKAVLDADLECPIILDKDGEVMDGRHRIMKAILEGRETIKIKRFQDNPSPCIVIDD